VENPVGVVLCGCGRFDGSEIQEAVLTLLHLDRAGARVRCFAPDAAQWAVCDAFTGAPRPAETRNMLQESARIARGRVEPLAHARAAELAALILPGGSGAARNLGSFAEHGARGKLRPELHALLLDCVALRKPIGAICIAPALVALALGDRRPRLTLGPLDREPALAAAATGAILVDCPVDDIVVDESLLLVSTPAYVVAQSLAEADAGIGRLVAEVLRLARPR
jgi:enhancing lycopene biosynthesis protein 2